MFYFGAASCKLFIWDDQLEAANLPMVSASHGLSETTLAQQACKCANIMKEMVILIKFRSWRPSCLLRGRKGIGLSWICCYHGEFLLLMYLDSGGKLVGFVSNIICTWSNVMCYPCWALFDVLNTYIELNMLVFVSGSSSSL